MYLGKEAAVLAFSKDMSKQGIGVITDMELEAGTISRADNSFHIAHTSNAEM